MNIFKEKRFLSPKLALDISGGVSPNIGQLTEKGGSLNGGPIPKQKWPSANKIWSNYGKNMSNPWEQCPTTDKDFHNKGQNCCAIRLSYALKASGVDFSLYPYNETKDGLPRGADALRDWLTNNMEGKPEIFLTPGEFTSKYGDNSTMGVIWMQLEGGTNHIDIYNRNDPKRFGSRSARAGMNGVTQVYFWNLTPEVTRGNQDFCR